MTRRAVIRPHAGGMGDSWIYSTLPRPLKEAGYDVYVGPPPKIVDEGKFRNPETVDLIWLRNPYVTGVLTEEQISPTDRVIGPYRICEQWIDGARRHKHGIEYIEHLNAIATGAKYPECHYVPLGRPWWRSRIVASPTAICSSLPPGEFDAFVAYIARSHGFRVEDVIVLESHYDGDNGRAALPNNERYRVDGIFEKADIFASCKRILCTESGDSSLASAIRKNEARPDVNVFYTSGTFNEKLFTFPNLKPFVSAKAGTTFARQAP